MRRLIFQLVLALIMVSNTGMATEDALFRNFQDPQAEAKPFVRWWWGENSVAEKEILREIEIMHEAGIGGYEINPISLPVETKLSAPSLQWLSPEFNRMVKVAVDATKKRGMIVDLIVGSGWPFGAEFLEPGEMTKRFYMNSIPVQGPSTFTKPINELKIPLKHGRAYAGALPPECKSIYLAPVDISDISQSIDVMERIKDGVLIVQVPAGKYIIHVGLVQEAFSEVHQGSPGAMGPVLDHYKAEALESYLNKMSSELGPVLGGKLGDAVRAIFCDSIELSAANWTTDIESVFRKQHGYDLMPYLPYIVNTEKSIDGEDAWSDRLKRVRYDYSKTLVAMFTERFIKVYHEWCNDNGCLSRYQAYGTPWLMGMLDSYLIPDIPETNNWFFTDAYSHGYLVWSKYCSSAGHIKGRRIISTEAMTNTRGVFQATLDMIKAADDMNFIMGINHSVLHGYTYSPPEEGPYARVRYGSYFNEQNPWWPYFKQWAEYNARLSAVFQNSKPIVSIAILGPRADLWSTVGLERQPFHTTPWYLPQLWQVFSQCGSGADHVTEPVLQNASIKNGQLQCGEMTYDTLLVASAVTMEKKTSEMLLKLAKAGVKIVFIDDTPSRGPSLNDFGTGDRQVKENIKEVLTHSKNVFQFNAPDSKKMQDKDLLNWADNLLNTIDLERDITMDALDGALYQIRTRDGDRDIFFLVNTDDSKTLELDAAFNSKNKTAWRWDPETATRSVYASPISGSLPVTLPPHGSLLLVFDSARAEKTQPQEETLKPGDMISGPWHAEFNPAQGDAFTIDAFELADLGKSEQRSLNTFAGTVTYKKTFRVDNAENISVINLGTVHGVSDVTLNDKQIGTRWYGQHVYDMSDAIQSGKNELAVKVTTVLHNYLRTSPSTSAAGFWTKNNKKPVSVGMVGPVQFMTKKSGSVALAEEPIGMEESRVDIVVDLDTEVGEMYNFWNVYPVTDQSPFLDERQFDQLKQTYRYAKYINCVRLLGGKELKKDDYFRGVDKKGQAICDFSEALAMLSGIRKCGFTPWIVLDNVPAKMSENPTKNHYGNTEPPADFDLWNSYVRQFVQALVDEFGRDQVAQWRFRVGTEPDLNPGHWTGTKQQYLKHYDYTVAAVRSVLPDADIGPGNVVAPLQSRRQKSWAPAIINHCASETNYVSGQTGTPLGFFGSSYYTTVGRSDRQFDAVVKFLRGKLDTHPEFVNVPVEIQEFGILSEGGERIIGDGTEFGGSWLAHFADKIYRLRVRRVYQWWWNTNKGGEIPIPLSHVMDMLEGMAGGTRLKPDVSHSSEADHIGCIAVKKEGHTDLIIFRHLAVRDNGDRIPVRVTLQGDAIADKDWTITRAAIIDGRHPGFMHEQKADIDRTGAVAGKNANSREIQRKVIADNKAKYKQMSALSEMKSPPLVVDPSGKVSLDLELDGHSVIYLRLQ